MSAGLDFFPKARNAKTSTVTPTATMSVPTADTISNAR